MKKQTAKPILFSGPMVNAILDGRKCMTRRVMKLQPTTKPDLRDDEKYRLIASWPGEGEFDGFECHCPYGRAGDRLWVREAIDVNEELEDPVYCADRTPFDPHKLMKKHGVKKWGCTCGVKPSIHMPRWASRLTLEVTAVKVERLWDISVEDARAEGADCDSQLLGPEFFKPFMAFKVLWESIHGKGSWDANPFCWVISFKKIEDK